MMRHVCDHAAHSHFNVSTRLLAVPPENRDFGSAPLNWFKGDIPDVEESVALILFRAMKWVKKVR